MPFQACGQVKDPAADDDLGLSNGRLGSMATAPPHTSDRPLAGRAVEMAAAVEVLEQATRGQAMALLVSGEAGVGKTVLVRAACSQVSTSPTCSGVRACL
jgi:DNA-binding NtrC family response regulator